MPTKSNRSGVKVSLEINVAFEEPSATRVDGVPADVAQVVPQVGERGELRVAVLAGQSFDHVGCVPVASAQDVFMTRGRMNMT